MAYIECCGKKHKAIVFELKLKNDNCVSKILKNAFCPHCGKNIIIIEEKMLRNGVEQIRYVRRQGKEADKLFDKLEKDMHKAAKVLDFERAAEIRDQLKKLREMVKK